jgi:hypothetical protein
VKLSHLRELTLHTDWDERIQFGDELLTIEEYIKRLFGILPTFLDGEEDLRERWSQPDTRQQLLNVLEESGFPEDKLEMTRRFLELEQCDMLDVLVTPDSITSKDQMPIYGWVRMKDAVRELYNGLMECAKAFPKEYVDGCPFTFDVVYDALKSEKIENYLKEE